MLRLHTMLAIQEPGDLDSDALNKLANDIGRLYDIIAKAYFS